MYSQKHTFVKYAPLVLGLFSIEFHTRILWQRKYWRNRRKRKKILATLSREEETFHSVRDHHQRTNGKRSTELPNKASHTPSGKMEEPIFPGIGIPKRPNLNRDSERNITQDPRYQNSLLLEGILRRRSRNSPDCSEEQKLIIIKNSTQRNKRNIHRPLRKTTLEKQNQPNIRLK